MILQHDLQQTLRRLLPALQELLGWIGRPRRRTVTFEDLIELGLVTPERVDAYLRNRPPYG